MIRTTNTIGDDLLDSTNLEKAFRLLDGRIRILGGSRIELVVCGGSALIAMELVTRTTRDVDVLALVDSEAALVSPVPFPALLTEAAFDVARVLGMTPDWLNNGPAGLLLDGLPEGILERAHPRRYGSHLTVHFIDRIDQVFLKLYAAADSLGVHVDDLIALEPSHDEVLGAARWCLGCDPSGGFRVVLLSMLTQLGYGDVVDKL